MSLRLPSQLDEPICFAHRGARAHAPENTADAFDLAVRLGATGIESDVWLTADDQLILTHDGTVGLRRRPIRSLARSELSGDLLTLPELFGRIPEQMIVSIDVKDDDAMAPLMTWASGLPVPTRNRLYLCHHEWEFLAEWRPLDLHVRLVDSTALKRMEHGPERRAHQLAEAGIDAVNLRQSEWTGGMATLFHRFERLCFGWDAQHPHILEGLFRMGLDAVYSDHVDLMMEVHHAHLNGG